MEEETDMKEATELEYLTWLKQSADFCPADSDVHRGLDEYFVKETGKLVPKDWRQE